MRIVLRILILILCLVGTTSPSRAEFRHLSSRFFGGEGGDVMLSDRYNLPSKLVAANARGDVLLIARTHVSMTFGGDLIGPGVVAVVLNPSGTPVWNRVLYQATQIAGVVIASVALADDGSAVLVGSFAGTVDFGGGPMTTAGSEAFVVKLDPAGHVAWQNRYAGNSGVTGNGVAFAPDGDIFVVGADRSSVDFGGGPIINLGSSDVFALRLNGQTGAHMWSRGYGQAGAQEGLGIAAGPGGQITLLCTIAGGINFGGGLLLRGAGNIALATLDGDANHIWSRVVGGTQSVTPHDIAVDGAGNTFISGVFGRAMDPGNGTLLVARPTALLTGFVASYAPGGDYRWSYALIDSLKSLIPTVGATGTGGCVALATASGNVEAGGATVLPAGFLFMDFDSLGAVNSVRRFSQPSPIFNSEFLCTNGDNVYIAGSTNGTIDFGGGDLVMGPEGRVFLAHLAVRLPPQLTIDNLTARLNDRMDVELSWSLASGEPLSGYYLTRRSGSSANARVISFGPAVDGDATSVDVDVLPDQRYTYTITVETKLGDLASSSTFIDVPSVKTNLEQNAPNPFNPITTFKYTLGKPAHVSIAIYDLAGALVCKIDQGSQTAGRHEAQWAGHNWSGNLVGSGVYFYRLEGAGDVPARKMILLK